MTETLFPNIYSSRSARGKESLLTLSNTVVILILISSILVAESVIMAVFHFLNVTNFWFELFFDSILLLIIISPILFLLVYKPMKNNINEKKKAEKELEDLLYQLSVSKEMIEEKLFETNLLFEELSVTRENLEKTNAEKDKFFSIIAHDLKSPFSGFIGLTQIMVDDIEDISLTEMKEFSKTMQSSATNLYKLLENLLEWARMQRGLIEFSPQESNLKSIIDQNLEFAAGAAKNKDIELISHIPETTSIYADLPILNTVIRNLISNAIKFTPRGGTVEVGTIDTNNDHKTTEVCVYIKDNGLGMNEDTLGKLFKIDQKVSRPGTENEPSTGLGLLLCKEFIEKLGGRIWVESEIGKGSTFYFTLKSCANQSV